VARDRKRAKQRRERSGAPARAEAAGQAPSQPVRADVPGALDHASGEVDEFDAALVRGADGVPATPDIEDEDLTEDALQDPGGPGGGSAGGVGGGGGHGQGPEERPSGAPLRGGNRAIGFLRASWAELQRVQWPDRRQVTQATAVVIGFVAIAGAYLGLADFVAKEIVEAVLA
jgi:preprotein translocase subunit SecE